jgi:hypothetical protein
LVLAPEAPRVKTQKAFIIILSAFFLSSLYMNLVQLRSNRNRPNSVNASFGQSEILCDVAKEHLHEHWSEQRENIEKVIQVVNHETEMKEKLKADISEISQTLALNPNQEKTFAEKYEGIFFQHVQTFKTHLNQNEPNWIGMFQTLKEFYRSEDKLVGDSFGESSLETFRKSQLKKRTTMLALIGQYANIPWDQNISW